MKVQIQITLTVRRRRRRSSSAAAGCRNSHLRQNLLSQIRVYYIEVTGASGASIHAADLRTTLARGVLVGGHCYGPLHPVHSILLNSIWYAAAFPFHDDDRIDVAVITANSLSRVVQRSLDGLVASLRHRCPAHSHVAALRHLRSARADLHAAVASARGSPPPPSPTESDSEAEATAFQAATEAAQHPKPATLAHFLSSVLTTVQRDALSVIAGSNPVLSSADIARLFAMLAPSPLPDDLPQPPL